MCRSQLLSGKVIYSLKDKGIFRLAELDLGTGQLVYLTNPSAGGDDMNANLSPDGKTAVFYSGRTGFQQIWRIDLQTKALQQLTNNKASDYDPSVSPDGSLIVFKSNRMDGYGDIYVMNKDGTRQTNLTPQRKSSEEWDPCFSRDGSKIFFVSRLTPGDPNTDELFVMDANGKNIKQLTHNDYPDWYPSVNPVTGSLAFISKTRRGSNDDIFVMNADGTGRKQLTQAFGDVGDPAWSPNGDRILFLRNDRFYQTYVMLPDGSQITKAPAQHDTQLGPVWMLSTANVAERSSKRLSD